MIHSVKTFKIYSREIKWTNSCNYWFFVSKSSYLKERNWVHLYLCVAGGQIYISFQHPYFIFGRQEEDNQKNTTTYPTPPFPDEDGFNILICLNSLKRPKAFPASQTSSRVSSSPHLINVFVITAKTWVLTFFTFADLPVEYQRRIIFICLCLATRLESPRCLEDTCRAWLDHYNR